jgi:aminoglycoside phosphotransferase (APT) family kinase protein
VDWKIAWWERVYEEDTLEEHPMVPRTLAWLKANRPVAKRISVVHGDYRSGNFLYDGDTNRITAILDWELGHLGDPHDDLSWVLMRGWGHYDESGAFLHCGMLTQEGLLQRYQERSGFEVDPDTLRYYVVLNTLKLGIIGFATGPRAASDGQSHQAVIVNLLTAVGYVCFDDLTRLLPSS